MPDHALLCQLHARTQGWVAGLVLLLEQARTGNVLNRAQIPTGRALLFDYFASEVFVRFSAAEQDFLLKVALLPKISVCAANELSANPQAEAILDDLARRNYFTVRHAENYEYNPLFREFLLARLQRGYTSEELAALRRRAAALAEASGNAEDTVQLWIDASAGKELSQYLYRAAPVLLGQGRGLLLAAWIGSMPTALREQDPWLLFWLGQERLPFAPPEARVHFENALTHFEARGERTSALLVWASIVGAVLHEGRNFGALDHWIETFSRIAGADVLPARSKIILSCTCLARSFCASLMALMNARTCIE